MKSETAAPMYAREQWELLEIFKRPREDMEREHAARKSAERAATPITIARFEA